MSPKKKLKILNVDPNNYSMSAVKKLRSVGIYKAKSYLKREEFLSDVADIDVLVLRFSFSLDLDFFCKAKKLKFIICNVTGPNHIDENEMKKRGVILFCLKGYYEFLSNIHATAELTWQLIMASQRPIFEAIESVRSGYWERDRFIGNEIFGKSIGIIGVGRIGKKILSYSKCFGLDIHAFDLNLMALDGVTIHDSLEGLFSKQLDIYTIHLPLNNCTKKIIDSKLLNKLKSGSVLVNTARGEVVDEGFINEMMVERGFRYYSDVVCDELNFSKSVFFKNKALSKNIKLTPHIGGAAYEAWWKTEEFCVNNFIEYLELYECKP